MSDYIPDLTQRYPEGFNSPFDYRDLTPEEEYKAGLDAKIYREKCKYLDGEPSEVAKVLKTYWDSKEPNRKDYKEYNEYCHACYDYWKDKRPNVIVQLCAEHGLTTDNSWDSFYGVKPDTFGIDVEYTLCGEIKHLHFLKNEEHLDYETFKNVFRDLYYLDMYPTMCYQPKDESKNKLILSNCSLGGLRIYDLKLAGVETEESIEQALNGFDEQKIKKEFDREWGDVYA